MTQKQKGYLALGGVVLLAACGMFGSDKLYNTLSKLTAEKVNYTEGTYTGTAEGFGGLVVAEVTVSKDGIKSVKLTGDGETPDLGGEALKTLEPAFVEKGSANVDGVSGCTYTSDAARKAVQQALDQASGKITVSEKAEAETKEEVKAETKAEAENKANTQSTEKSTGGLKTGLAIVSSMKKSKDAGEKDGSAQVSSVAVAVVVDANGKIVNCVIDNAQSVMGFTAEGKVVMEDSFRTKKELKDEYGMKAASKIGKEWYEQAEALEQYVIGKTAEEIMGIAVSETTAPTDADLSANVTVKIGEYQEAIIQAMENAKELGTEEGDRLGLGIITNMSKSKDATAEKDGQCQAYSTYVAATVDADGRVTADIIDSSQGTVKFDTKGKITSDLTAGVKTKKQLGADYGMIKASSIGKEWYEQAEAMEAYLVGKTSEEIMGIAVNEEGKAADADLASSVTVSIGGYQEAAAKAIANAK